MGLPSIFQQPLPRVLSQIHIHASLNNPSEGSVKLASNNPSEQIKQPLRELNPLFDPSEGLVEGRFETGPPVRVPSTNPSVIKTVYGRTNVYPPGEALSG